MFLEVELIHQRVMNLLKTLETWRRVAEKRGFRAKKERVRPGVPGAEGALMSAKPFFFLFLSPLLSSYSHCLLSVLSTLHPPLFKSVTTQGDWDYYNPHFTDDEPGLERLRLLPRVPRRMSEDSHPV